MLEREAARQRAFMHTASDGIHVLDRAGRIARFAAALEAHPALRSVADVALGGHE